MALDMVVDFLKRLRGRGEAQVFCPGCTKDLNSRVGVDGTTVRDRTFLGEDYIKFRCGACLTVSTWDFDSYPIPVLIKAIQYRVWVSEKNADGIRVTVVKSGVQK